MPNLRIFRLVTKGKLIACNINKLAFALSTLHPDFRIIIEEYQFLQNYISYFDYYANLIYFNFTYKNVNFLCTVNGDNELTCYGLDSVPADKRLILNDAIFYENTGYHCYYINAYNNAIGGKTYS